MLQQFNHQQLILAGKAKDIKIALNSISNAHHKDETLQQYLLQRSPMRITLHLK